MREQGLFPGASLSRVMLQGERSSESMAAALTYGWYSDRLVTDAFDFGVAARFADGERGYGPTARLTLGTDVVAARLSARIAFNSAEAITVGLDVVITLSEEI